MSVYDFKVNFTFVDVKKMEIKILTLSDSCHEIEMYK